MVYERMVYIVRHNSETSDAFKSIIGILIGDTCSPILWNIYLADIKFPISTIQLGYRTRWLTSRIWNKLMISCLCQKQQKDSTNCNIFKEHYDIKAGKAKNIGNMILATQSVIGKLPPWELRKFYMALMDPHLTHGAEISLDIDPPLLEKLEDIQHLFLCRLLLVNVGEKCMNALLFTETAVIPIKYRRIITALKYLKYLLLLPPDLYAAYAMRDSISLAAIGKPCWFMDILVYVVF
jgi:hypothetical protein